MSILRPKNGYATAIFYLFFFGTACGTNIFPVATSATIFWSLGWWYVPVLSLSFFDIYGNNIFTLAFNNKQYKTVNKQTLFTTRFSLKVFLA